MKRLSTLIVITFCAVASSAAPSQANDGILVVGGTGQLGSYHVNQLSAAGERVIVLARPSSTYERIEGSTYEVVIADLMDADAVKAAVSEAKPAVIIDASNVPGIRMEDGDSFYWRSLRTLIDAAQASGVTQIIRHSARGARQMLVQPPAMFSDEPRVINYMRDLARAELALETASTNSDLEYTLILNSNLPPEPAAPTGNGALVDDLTLDYGITRSDLARITNPCILNPACYGKTLNGVDETLPEAQR
jgi:nucleoside-diphosphate-sugar epimerase